MPSFKIIYIFFLVLTWAHFHIVFENSWPSQLYYYLTSSLKLPLAQIQILCNEKSKPKNVIKPEAQAILRKYFHGLIRQQVTSKLFINSFLDFWLTRSPSLKTEMSSLFCVSQVSLVFHLLTLYRKSCLMTLWRMSRSSYINSFNCCFFIITSKLPSFYLSPFANINTWLVLLILSSLLLFFLQSCLVLLESFFSLLLQCL